jgi:RHS repeat-associated protein
MSRRFGSAALLTVVLVCLTGLGIAQGQTLVSVAIQPHGITTVPGSTNDLLFLGTFSDGSVQDLTSQTAWTVPGFNPAQPPITISTPGTDGSPASFLVDGSVQHGIFTITGTYQACNPQCVPWPASIAVVVVAGASPRTNSNDLVPGQLHITGGTELGFPTFSTNSGGPFDFVDPATDGVNVSIPIRSKTGLYPFSYSLGGSSAAYIFYYLDRYGAPHRAWLVATGLSGRSNIDTYLTAKYVPKPCTGHPYNYEYAFSVTDPAGTSHGLAPLLESDPACGATKATLNTNDGSGYAAVVDMANYGSPTVYDKSGNKFTYSSVPPNTSILTMQTPNGAKIKEVSVMSSGHSTETDTYTDTLNQTLNQTVMTAFYPISPDATHTSATYSFTGGDGATQIYTVNYAAYSQETNFGCTSVPVPSEWKPIGAVYLPQTVILPTAVGGQYTLDYEHTYQKSGYVTGRLATLTLPTGGSTTYSYAGTGANAGGINCTDMMSVQTLTRAVHDSTSNTTSTWTYDNPNGISTTDLSESVTVTKPDSNKEVYLFSNAFKTEKKMYGTSTTGTPFVDTIICYNNQAPPCSVPGLYVRSPITAVKSSTSLDGNAPSAVTTTIDTHGMPLVTSKYDFGAGTASSVSTIVYGSLINGACSATALNNIFIFDRVCTATVTDPSHNSAVDSYVTFTYDGKGNPTTKQNATVNVSTLLPTTMSYNSNGTLASVHEPNGGITNFHYDGTGGCNDVNNQGALLTSTDLAVSGLSTSQQWDCVGGVVTAATDANGKEIDSTYVDPLWRRNSSTDALENTTGYSYTLNTSESSLNFNSNNSTVDSLTTVDGLGRVIESQRKQGPSSTSYDSVQTIYGWTASVGALLQVSMPYAAGAGSGGGTIFTTTQYDAAGRPHTVTDGGGGTVTYTYIQNDVIQAAASPSVQKQLEYDGLGRLTSVCEITTGSGGGGCTQANTGKVGYFTKYTYDTTTLNSNVVTRMTVQQNFQSGSPQTRVYLYDLLGRLVQETNPETGTTQYFWDQNTSVCGSYTSNGDLMEKRDNANVSICYGYDAIHRLIGFGPTNSTKCTGLVYDAASANWPPPSGSNLQNTAGRLIEAYTNSACDGHPSIVTDEWFSYSPRGEVTDVYEKTPHSGGYYHVNQSYWPHGAVASIAVSGVPTIYYGASDGSGLDGEGRVTKVTASSGLNPVTAASYNQNGVNGPVGSLMQVTYGSSDFDAFSYDTNTGRMTGYTLNVGSQNYAGTLLWNANGTVQSLKTVDGITGGYSSTPTTVAYTYDDLGRLATANDTVNLNQTYTYDPFGNIRTGGPPFSWMQTYDTTKNQYQPSGTCNNSGSICYDADGNLLSDTFHTYTWDAGDKLTSIDAGTGGHGGPVLTDALGRVVESTINNVTQQILYGPTGKLGFVNGQTMTKIRIPLPGGGQAVYNGGTLAKFNHPDWQGNIRVASKATTQTLAGQNEYTPFGMPYNNGTVGAAGPSFNQSFGDVFDSHEYDALNRELHPVQGRWIQPDPAGLSAVDSTNPQTWNRYAYVLNNPLSLGDPTGLDCVYMSNDGSKAESIDHSSRQGECWDNGGFWADGNVADSSWVQAFSNSNNILVGSNVNGFLATTLAGSTNDGGIAFSQMFSINSSVPDILNSPYTPANYIDPMSPSARQTLRAIANAAPTLCGGGAFGYYGKGVTAFGAKAFTGGIVEADSQSGISGGSLNEIGAGGVGGGSIVSSGGTSGLVYTELAEIPFLGNVGLVGFPSGVGVYAEGEAGNREFGGGLYANIVPNAGCHK